MIGYILILLIIIGWLDTKYELDNRFSLAYKEFMKSWKESK